MSLCLHDKIVITGRARLLYRGPNSAASFGDLLITFAARTPLKIVEAISGKNQMRVRIDKSRQHNASASINDLRAARFLFDLIARTDCLDLAVADEHSAIVNDPERRQLCPDTRALWSAQRDELRSVQDGE